MKTNIQNFDRLLSFVDGVTTGLNIGYPKLILERPEAQYREGTTVGSCKTKNLVSTIYVEWSDNLHSEWTLAHELRHSWQHTYDVFSSDGYNRDEITFEEYLVNPAELDAEAFAYALLRELYKDNDRVLHWLDTHLLLTKGSRKYVVDEIIHQANQFDFGYFPYQFMVSHKNHYRREYTPEERLLMAIFGEQV